MTHYLCEELIDEIIGRLPPKSLIRFRSVSRSWYARISSPSFIAKHALQSAKTPQKAILRKRVRYMKDGAEALYTLHPEDRVKICMENFYVIGSCNGITCLYEKKPNFSISLWNLSIGRKLSVPNPPFGRIVLGFGFDPITHDYKIVSIPHPKDDGIEQKTFFYSMKTNSWNQIAFPTTASYSHVKNLSSACLVNGALHWIVICDPDNMVHNYIMTFDLSANVFGMIPLPLPRPNRVTGQLTTVKGCLAMMSIENNNILLRVWKENNNVASWSKAFNLTSRRYEGVDKVFCLKSSAKVFKTYNPETGIRSTFEKISDSSYKVDKDMCVESLELLHGDLLEQPYFVLGNTGDGNIVENKKYTGDGKVVVVGSSTNNKRKLVNNEPRRSVRILNNNPRRSIRLRNKTI